MSAVSTVNESPPRLLSLLTPSVSSDDSLSSDCGSAPASPRSAKPRAALGDETSPPPPASAPSAAPVARPAISLETLVGEKQAMLARFEEKFNEKILSRHRELMEEQRRAALESNDRDRSLSEEVRRLKDELEEQKFSHQVELSLEKKKVEKLEEELSRTQRHRPEPASVNADKRVKELEAELKSERSLRITQLKSLEQLHFAEFRQIEKKHAEFVNKLVASYREEINALKKNAESEEKAIEPREVVVGKASPEQRESCETAAAAAALSSLAGSPPAARQFGDPSGAGTNDDRPGVGAAADRMPPACDERNCGTPAPPASPGEVGNEAAIESRARKNPSPPIPESALRHKRSFSDFSDISSAASSDGDEPERSSSRSPAKKARRSSGQRKRVEEILRKAGRMPPRPSSRPPRDRPPGDANGAAREKRKLSDETKEYLRAWMMSPEHCDHPYPTPEEKADIMADTGIGFTELNTWFVNNRKRFWLNVVKPKIPEIKKAHRMRKAEESCESCSAETCTVST